MRVWVVCLILFFGAAELYQWIQKQDLPLPVTLAAGLLLAIASNLDKQTFLPWSQSQDLPWKSERAASPKASVLPPIPAAERYYPGPQLPQLHPPAQPAVSFTIQKAPESQEV